MHTFVIKNIVPKLEMSLQNLIINPHQQMLDEWNAVMDWQDFVNPAILVTMLDKLFFPKWLQVRFLQLLPMRKRVAVFHRICFEMRIFPPCRFWHTG